MRSKYPALARRYRAALLVHLRGRGVAGLGAQGLGAHALSAGASTLDLAKLHEELLVKEVLPDAPSRRRAALIRRAGVFFGVAITPIAETHPKALAATALLKKFVETLSRRTVELAASNLELSLEIAQRKAAENALRKSESHYAQLLKQSDNLQEQLRQLSRQILSAQEDERRRVSRELHDVIAQTLTGIHVRLATLNKEARGNGKNLEHNIALTQCLVEKSVAIVHQFARELRPAVLDDLGLVPALRSYVKAFSERTKLRVHLGMLADVEELTVNQRTVLFRVAQEALTNVSRHAAATEVEISIQRRPDGVCLEVRDNGKSFRIELASSTRGRKRLGLLGMRERIEMIGGRFQVESAPGRGTTVTACLAVPKARPAPDVATPPNP